MNGLMQFFILRLTKSQTSGLVAMTTSNSQRRGNVMMSNIHVVDIVITPRGYDQLHNLVIH